MRGARACVALEVRRGQRGMLIGIALAAVAGLANTLGPSGADSPAAILLLVLPGIIGFFAGIAPYGTLIADRHEGRLSAERALPQRWIATAGARLVGAAIRALVTPAFAVALAVGVSRRSAGSISWATAGMVAVSSWMLVSIICWVLMAANVRWSMLRLWWVPTSMWVIPQVMPDAWRTAAANMLRPVWAVALSVLADPERAAVPLLAMVGITAVTWVGASALYASGLRRYVHDPDPLGLRRKRDRARPALEYPAGRRTLIAAVALHDARLGIEQLVNQWAILAILVIVAIAGPDTLRELAPLYIRIIGYMVPGAVLIGLLAARRSGALAALRFLPHPRWKVAAGKLAAVTALSVLAAALGTVGSALGEDAFAFTPRQFATNAVVVAANVWLAVAVTAWWRVRHLLWLVPFGLAVGVIGYFFANAAGPAVSEAYRLLRHPFAPMVWFATVAVVGIPLFSWGLANYEKR